MQNYYGEEYKNKTDDCNFIELGEESSSYSDFSSLRCWQYCWDFKLFFYQTIIPKLREDEKHNLNLKIRKSARSIRANIDEGGRRYHYQEAIQFLRISRRSLHE